MPMVTGHAETQGGSVGAEQYVDCSSITVEDAQCRLPWLQVAIDGECWRWTRAHNAYGYGVKRVAEVGNTRFIHRLVYEALVGPIGELTIDHLCRVRDCCNPRHLEAVPMGVNRSRAQPFSKDNTICRNGHTRTQENTRWTKSRGNLIHVCRDCRREVARRYQAKPEVAERRQRDSRERYLARKANA